MLFRVTWQAVMRTGFPACRCWSCCPSPEGRCGRVSHGPSLPLRRTEARGGDSGPRCWVGVVAFGASNGLGRRFIDENGRALPPAYHDEFSYRFQAETFLAGRTWFPSAQPRAELFDQMHVLNEGRFASRYFPGVGLWLAPFLAIGNPWLAQQFAHALAAMLLFFIGRELKDGMTGFIAGLLFALSPGLLLFSNLLVAHHPTLLGLLLFVASFLRMQRTGSLVSAVLSGCGLAFAMICRPMTAAGVGLPFGVAFGWWLLWGEAGTTVRLRRAAVLVAPLLIGVAGMFAYNRSITGEGLVAPYQLYTDIYTPRHVYGFNNVVRGEQRLGPKVLDNYDRWAENLDATLAWRNVRRRVVASLRWTLGIIPLSFALLVLLANRSLRGRALLPLAAIISLHVVHLPYWFEGIMGWHYVLESAPFWLLLAGLAVSQAAAYARSSARRSPLLLLLGLLLVGVISGTLSVPLAPGSRPPWQLWTARLESGAQEILFARHAYGTARRQVDMLRGSSPAVVLVIPDPADRSLDYVTNSPALDDDVLFARVPAGEESLESLQQLARLFPNRVPILFRAREREARLLESE